MHADVLYRRAHVGVVWTRRRVYGHAQRKMLHENGLEVIANISILYVAHISISAIIQNQVPASPHHFSLRTGRGA